MPGPVLWMSGQHSTMLTSMGMRTTMLAGRMAVSSPDQTISQAPSCSPRARATQPTTSTGGSPHSLDLFLEMYRGRCEGERKGNGAC